MTDENDHIATGLDAAGQLLLQATKQATVEDAVHWLAQGWRTSDASPHELLRALLASAEYPESEAALQRLSRSVAKSDVSSARVLFDLDIVERPEQFRDALDRLASLCGDGSLRAVNARDVRAAQRKDSFTIEALCSVAGLSYRDLSDRVTNLPSNPRSDWAPSQIQAAFEVLDAIVRGTEASDLPGATPARPLELLLGGTGTAATGWEAVEVRRSDGVPYEVLLAQRAAGGAWLAHRNRTSARVRQAVADQLARELETSGITFLRATGAGGPDAEKKLMEITGCGKQIGFAVLDPRGRAKYGIVLAVANDSGTARKSVRALAQMDKPSDLPVAVLVSGPGWSIRNELADLARAFAGRIYGDVALSELVEDVTRTTNLTEGSAR